MSHSDFTIVHPDPKGRISLGKFIPKGATGFRVWTDKSGQIILEPCVEIPVREAWLFSNKEALTQVRQGLADSAGGKTSRRGRFAPYADDDIE